MGIIWGFMSSAFTSASYEGGYVDPEQDCMLLLTEKEIALKFLSKSLHFLQYFDKLILFHSLQSKKKNEHWSVWFYPSCNTPSYTSQIWGDGY